MLLTPRRVLKREKENVAVDGAAVVVATPEQGQTGQATARRILQDGSNSKVHTGASLLSSGPQRVLVTAKPSPAQKSATPRKKGTYMGTTEAYRYFDAPHARN